MIADVDPTVDYVFKRLFGNESRVAILCNLLNGAMRFPPGKEVRQVRLLNPFSEKEFKEEKLSILDVSVEDELRRRFNVEMERLPEWVFPHRALYYWADLHRRQLFQGEDYWTIQPTYSLCFLGKSLFDDAHYHHVFRPLDPEHGNLLLCKDLEMHFIELPKFTLTPELIQSDLERWVYFLKHGASLDSEQLPASLDTSTIRQALEVLNVFRQNEVEYERYLDRLKAKRDASTRTNLDGARKYGYDHGRDEGYELGAKVVLSRQIQFLQQLLKQPQTPNEELAGLSVEELSRRAAQLEQQSLAGQNGTP